MIDNTQKEIEVTVEPDKRYTPICHICKTKANGVHSYHERMIRDLNVFDARTMIRYRYRKIRCRTCGIVVEDLGLVEPSLRMTRRLARYILELCKMMTIREIADHLGLDWKTIKDIHKEALKNRYEEEDIGYPVLLAVDEISVKKQHRYLTIIINWETGRVLFVGRGRRCNTLKDFFRSLTGKQRAAIQAVAMDMWDPYIKAVTKYCPHAAIVFDQFHVISSFGRVINRVLK
ncbi:TPA: ISL3 family transposase [Candidatus Acetothermia bacterium]|nr:ISL3 family transposase [Candidatus Acetothermia bacterium]